MADPRFPKLCQLVMDAVAWGRGVQAAWEIGEGKGALIGLFRSVDL